MKFVAAACLRFTKLYKKVTRDRPQHRYQCLFIINEGSAMFLDVLFTVHYATHRHLISHVADDLCVDEYLGTMSPW